MRIFNPRQTIIVTTRGSAEVLGKKVQKDNAITLDWHTPLSFDPFLYCICIGKTRFSLQILRESKVFCVNFMDLKHKDIVLYCGRNSGRHVDKFESSKIIKEECEKIDCPRIDQAVGYLECEIINEIENGDHILFIGKVLKQEQKEGQRIFHLDANDFGTVN